MCQRSIRKRPVLVVLALATAGVVAAFGLLPSAMGNPDRKPDLVITRAEASGSDHAFQGFSATMSFKYVTKNKGLATARGSRTSVYLVPEFAGRHPAKVGITARPVPKLHRGDSDRDAFTLDVSTRRLALGAYEIEVCADSKHQVKEEREGNNCRSTGREFYVAKADWQGSVSGVGGCCGAAKVERWTSNGGAHLSFGEYLGDGVFRYDFNGVLQWTVAGVNMGGCTLSGSGTEPVDESNSGPGIRLNYGKARYLGTAALNDPFFTIYFTGAGGFPCSATDQGPKNLDFLTIRRRDLLFNQKKLKGRFNDFGAEGVTWTWNFS